VHIKGTEVSGMRTCCRKCVWVNASSLVHNKQNRCSNKPLCLHVFTCLYMLAYARVLSASTIQSGRRSLRRLHGLCVCVRVCVCVKFCVSARIPASHFCAHDYSHMYLRARPKCVQRALVEKTLNLLNIGSTKRYSTSALRTRIKRLSRGLSRLKLCKCTL